MSCTTIIKRETTQINKTTCNEDDAHSIKVLKSGLMHGYLETKEWNGPKMCLMHSLCAGVNAVRYAAHVARKTNQKNSF